MTTYFLFAGEASGDLHGSHLIKALQSNGDAPYLTGVGGPRMRKEGLDCFIPMEQFEVMGFSDVLKSLPRLWKLFYRIRNQILKLQPDCVILIDYPGFNLRIAHSLRQQGYKGKLIHYICPTVWAHGKKRIETLSANYDLLLTIFPFEADYFSHTNLKVEYVGNPLIETLRNHSYDAAWASVVGLHTTDNLIALFPGSRPGEIKKHLPQQLETAAQLKQQHPQLRFALSCMQDGLHEEVISLIEKNSLKINEDLFIVPPQYNYDLMRSCKTALAKSGTVTLELALHGIPSVVHYELSALNYYIAKYILRLNLPHYCIVNILGKKTIFPELIGRSPPTQEISKQLAALHFDETKRQKIENDCQKVKMFLGEKSTHQCAAKAIQELIPC